MLERVLDAIPTIVAWLGAAAMVASIGWQFRALVEPDKAEVHVHFCESACAARGAGYALAKAFFETCEAKGSDFEAGCENYIVERDAEDQEGDDVR